ncbi:MAG: GNAT family N-acetyltransferase [Paludibacter sp.]
MIESKIVKKWDHYLDYFSEEKRDIYFEEKYVKLYENNLEEAVCFVYNSDNNYFIFPFLRRRFIYEDKAYYDFETPYGYGGPISNISDENFNYNGLRSFYDYCQTNNYIAGFVRFHPLLKNTLDFDQIGTVINDRKTIAINLQYPEEEIWLKEIKTKNRNTIKKGINNGLEFIEDASFDYFADFSRLYNATMHKLGADDFYYFDELYYLKFREDIKNSFLGVVTYNNEVISTAIFFYSNDYGHYHLSGSNRDYLELCPNNFLLWEAAKVFKRKGIKYFHLGGGTNSDEHNSLLEFKRKFSDKSYDFCIGKVIFNDTIYQLFCCEWETRNKEKAQLFKSHLLKYKL